MRDPAKVLALPLKPHEVRSAKIWHCKYRTLEALAALRKLEELVIATFLDDAASTLRLRCPTNTIRRLLSKAERPALAVVRSTGKTDQYSRRSGLISCRIVVAISSIDLVVEDSQRMPSRFISCSASLTS